MAGIHGGAETLPGMAAMDPAIGNAVPARRHMIVKQAFGGVKDIALGQAQIAHMLQQVHEIAVIGLVRADIFGGVDRVELGAERSVAEAEASVIDVGQDDEFVEFLQILQRAPANPRKPASDGSTVHIPRIRRW